MPLVLRKAIVSGYVRRDGTAVRAYDRPKVELLPPARTRDEAARMWIEAWSDAAARHLPRVPRRVGPPLGGATVILTEHVVRTHLADGRHLSAHRERYARFLPEAVRSATVAIPHPYQRPDGAVVDRYDLVAHFVVLGDGRRPGMLAVPVEVSPGPAGAWVVSAFPVNNRPWWDDFVVRAARHGKTVAPPYPL